jgi:hypothetical protein
LCEEFQREFFNGPLHKFAEWCGVGARGGHFLLALSRSNLPPLLLFIPARVRRADGKTSVVVNNIIAIVGRFIGRHGPSGINNK